jgi:hypothetical protein
MNSLRSVRIYAVILVTGMIALSGENAESKNRVEKPQNDGVPSLRHLAKQDGTTSKKGGLPPGVTLNACGCYRWNDTCVCTTRNGKCECPEECEPVGCDAKRKKQIEKEIADEEKRILDEVKKREEAEHARLKAEETRREKAAEELEAKQAADDLLFPSSQDAGVVDEPQKPSKKSRKPAMNKKEG